MYGPNIWQTVRTKLVFSKSIMITFKMTLNCGQKRNKDCKESNVLGQEKCLTAEKQGGMPIKEICLIKDNTLP